MFKFVVTSNFMTTTRLEIPPTLRTPNLDEVPNKTDIVDAIEKSRTANIVQGFIIKHNENKELPFKFYAEINVNNSELWNLFKALTLHLPDEISLIFNHADNEATFGNYQDKYAVINKLSNFTTELSQDCFLEFGVIHQTDDFLAEVFVDCTKYIKYWGMHELEFRKVMNEFKILEIPDLNFIDEFPKVREALRLHADNVIETDELIETLKKEFT